MVARRSSVFDKTRGDTSAFPYRLYGGATRPDAISGLDTGFYEALMQLYANAPPEVQRELGLTSGFRSREVQQALFDASDKSGKMVARPGHSKHEIGNAADLYGFGLGGDNSVSDATREWVHSNANKYGLNFPMDYEPWHIQMVKQVSDATGMSTEQASKVVASYTPEQRRNAIASIESQGSGDYAAVGPEADPAGHRARGRYQVMDYNLQPWAKQYLGMENLTPEQYMKDPALQDKLFDAVMGDYVKKYGEEGAAQAWFGGPGSVGKGGAGKDVLGTTGSDYVKKYMAALTGTPKAGHPPNPTVGTGGYVAPGANTTQVPGSEDKDKDKPDYADIASNLGALTGAGGKGVFKLPTMTTRPAAASQAQWVSPIMESPGRDQLALLMQRLNTNKLWG